MDLIGAFLDVILHMDRHLGEMVRQYGPWIYGIIFGIVFCETGLVITPFLPGDSLLFVAGTLWAATERDPLPLALTIVAAAFCGDNLNYFIGRTAGHRIASANSRLFNRDALERTHRFYERHGGKTVIMARFLPVLRTFAPFVAGIAQMPYGRYIVFSVAASLLWVGLVLYAGYFFGNVPVFHDHLNTIVLIGTGAAIVPVLLAALLRFIRKKR